jgi:hypothetical protein
VTNHWAACLEAWFEGKEGCPTIGLEAVADNNLWIWHNAFGFAGSLNDIIWDRSPLYKSMIVGAHDQLNFPFVITDHQFDHLYYLVNSIYTAISWFLSTINNPPTTLDSFCYLKQEVGRKQLREPLV